MVVKCYEPFPPELLYNYKPTKTNPFWCPAPHILLPSFEDFVQKVIQQVVNHMAEAWTPWLMVFPGRITAGKFDAHGITQFQPPWFDGNGSTWPIEI